MTSDSSALSRRIAILSEPGGVRDLILDIALDAGWRPELIDDYDLTRTDPTAWGLIVIVDEAGTSDLARRGAMASRHPQSRVLVVSSNRDPQHVADVLMAGVDDYLIAPFDPQECQARMQSLLTRSPRSADQRRFSLVFDFSKRTIMSGPMFVALPPREWDTLITLLEAEGRSVPANEIEQSTWWDSGSHQTVASTISRIRRRFDSRGFRVIQISTVRGEGYRAVFRRSSDELPRGYSLSVRAPSNN